jgi:hypothetical protein
VHSATAWRNSTSSTGGTPERTIEGALDADGRRVMIFGVAPRAIGG